MDGSRSLSRTLAVGHRREIGRYDVPWSAGLAGLRMAIMLANFHKAGMLARQLRGYRER